MKKTLFLWLMLLIMGFSGFAQTDVIVGTNSYSSNNRVPDHLWFKNSYSQTIYLAEEIGMSGTINSIAYMQTNTSGTRNITVYMAETAQTSFASTSDAIAASEFTEVFNGNWSFTQNEWAEIVLDSPFNYSGSGNLVIAFITSNDNDLGNSKYWRSSTGTGRSVNSSSDVNTFSLSSTFSYLNDYYPDIQLTIFEGEITCHSVANLAVSNVTSESAELSWTAPEDGGSYVIMYKKASDSWDDEDAVVTIDGISETSYELTDLDDNTSYTVRVFNDCGDGMSSAKNASFTTPCVAIYDVSKSWDFEENNTAGTTNYPLPACWERGSSSTYYPYVYETTATSPNVTSGIHYLYFSSTGSTAILPVIDTETLDITELQLSFNARTYSTASFLVGVMTDPTDDTTFDTVATLQLTSDFDAFDVNFAEYEGEGQYIALKSTSYSSIYVDDVVLDYIPECPRVQNLAVSNITGEGATVTWNGTNDNYLVRYRPANDTTGEWNTDDAEIDGTTATLSNLDAVTTYIVQVAPDCDDINENSYKGTTFTTTCNVYELDFETSFENANEDQCWTVASKGYVYIEDEWDYDVYTYPDFVRSSYYTYARTGTGYLEIGGEDGYTMVLAAPAVNADIETLRLQFYVRESSSSSYFDEGVFQVGVMSNPADTSTFTLVQTIDVASTTYELQTVDFNNAGVTGSDYNIAFRYIGAGYDGYSMLYYVDDIIIKEIPACLEPSGLAVSNITTTTADIAWTSEEEDFNLYFKKASEEDYEVVEGVSLTDGVYTLENLEPSSDYMAYVATVCPDGTESASQPVKFSTACDAIVTLPYPQNFDAVTTDSLPNCWTRINPSSNFPHVTTSHPKSGKALEFRANGSSYAVLPEFTTDLSELQISFFTRREGENSGTLEVGYLIDMDTATFVPYYSISSSQIGDNEYHKAIVKFVDFEAPEEGTANIAFKYSNAPSATYWYWYVDEVVVDYVSDCAEAVSLQVASVGDTYADLTWIAEGIEDFTIYYRETADVTADFEAVENVSLDENNIYTLTELEPNTAYTWYVVSNCSEDEIESEKASFTTTCSPTDEVPNTWNFETGNTAGTSAYPLPECWVRVGTSANSYPYVYESSYSSYSGSKYLYFWGNGNAVAMQALSDDININELQMTLYLRSYTSDADCFIVGVMSNISDMNTFVPVKTFTPTSSYQICSVNFSEYDGEGKYIVLKSATSSSVYVDDINLSYIPNCPSPEKNSVTASNLSGHNATISWVDNDETHNSWTVYYKANNATEWSQTEAGPQSSVELTNLDPSTTYQVYVITNCDEQDENPDATLTITFQTTVACPAPTALQANATTNTATISWTGNADSYIVAWGTESANVDGNSYEITGLSASTSYTVSVTANCGEEDGTSTASTVSFMTACDIITDFTYTESFEAGLGCWTAEIINSATWATSTYYSSDGSQSVRFPYTNGAIGTLTSPVFDFSTLTTPTLSYDMYLKEDNGKFDTVGVYYRTSATSEWKHITTHENNGTADTFGIYTFTLPEATSSTYQIMFKGYGNYGYATYLDNIRVFDSIGGETPVECNAPTGLAVNGQTQTTANVSWNANGATAWKLQYKLASASAWGNEIDVNTNPSYQITGLTAATDYQVRVKAVCDDNNESEWTAAVAFSTLPEDVEPCNAPTNVTVSDFDNSSITITWDANGASAWNVQYRVKDAATWTAGASNITTTTYTITGLEEATIYQIQVQAVCEESTSDWSEMLEQTTGINDLLKQSISLYPNPANDYVDVRVSDNDVKVSRLEVYDVYGKLLNEVEVVNNPTRINVSSLANGMYYVRVITESGVATKNFIKK